MASLLFGKGSQKFITIFALLGFHSRVGGNPLWCTKWIPAKAGMAHSGEIRICKDRELQSRRKV